MNAKRLTTPKENVQQLQEKLGHAAKENKSVDFMPCMTRCTAEIFCGKRGVEFAPIKELAVSTVKPSRRSRSEGVCIHPGMPSVVEGW